MLTALITLADGNEYDNTVTASRNQDMDICAWVWVVGGCIFRLPHTLNLEGQHNFCFKGPLLLLIATDLGRVVKDKIFSLVNNEAFRVNFMLLLFFLIPNLENVNNESKGVQSMGQFNMRARRDLRPGSLAVEGLNP